jgi:hypothetical protein
MSAVMERAKVKSKAQEMVPIGALPQIIKGVGLLIPEDTTFEVWLQAAQKLEQHHDESRYWFGDLILFAEGHFNDDQIVQLYDQYNKDTLRKYRHVCKSIPLSRRHAKLTFGHHEVIAALEPDEQDELLDMAERKKWNRDDLRAEKERRHPETVRRRTPPLIIEHNAPDPGEIGLVKAEEVAAQEEARQRRSAGPVTAETMFRPVGNGVTVEPVKAVEQPNGHDDAATYLRGMMTRYSSPDMNRAIQTILEERDRLLAIVGAARRAVQVGIITPDLEALTSATA